MRLHRLVAAVAVSLALPFALVRPAPVLAQELAVPPASWPTLPSHGATVDDFVPRGWTVEFKATGDLNRDGCCTRPTRPRC